MIRIGAHLEMGCGTVVSGAVHGFLVSPGDIQSHCISIPTLCLLCSGGLFKLLIRKIISPNKCDILSRWLITKWASRFLLGYGWFLHAGVSRHSKSDSMLFCWLFVIYSERVQFSCFKIHVDGGFFLRASERQRDREREWKLYKSCWFNFCPTRGICRIVSTQRFGTQHATQTKLGKTTYGPNVSNCFM